jgi:hypothetical protein
LSWWVLVVLVVLVVPSVQCHPHKRDTSSNGIGVEPKRDEPTWLSFERNAQRKMFAKQTKGFPGSLLSFPRDGEVWW